MTFQTLGSGSWTLVMVIGIAGLVKVDIEERWVVVKVQGSK